MNYKSVTIISIIVTAIFVMPLFSFAEDEDETVPGAPFQMLQDQIDELKEQIDALQTGPVKAYVSKQINDFPPLVPGITPPAAGEAAEVITLDLPAGDYINTITIAVSYYGGAGEIFDATQPGYLSCEFLDDSGTPITGHRIGGSVIGQVTHAITMELELVGPTIAILKCENATSWGNNITDMTIHQAIWTAIKVGELDNQPPVPPD